MRAKPSSTNIATALAAIARASSAFWLLRGDRFPRSRRSNSNALRSGIILLLALLACGLSLPSSSYAATTWMVCTMGCSYTTIAAAIAAPSTLGGDTISITDSVQTEHGITVSKNLTIKGQGASATAVDGGGLAGGSVFIVNGGVTATIQDVTIRNGNNTLYPGGGGGIFNSGTLTLCNSTLTGNGAYYGGGIYNFGGGTVTLRNSTLSRNFARFGGGIVNYLGTFMLSNSTLTGNTAAYFGGGIFNNSGTATIGSSTLSDNSARGSGGGIYNSAGTATIGNSTLSGNSAGAYGGGIYNFYGTLTLSNGTLSGNSAGAFFGGGILNGGTLSAKNSIVANSLGGPDCSGTIAALGANLDTDGSCGGFTPVTSLLLNLGPLALNAPGSTKTLALLPGSVAINAAPDCTDVSGSLVTTDQRGVTRPDNGESACDIGAFELVDQTPFASFTGKLEVTVSTGSFGLNSSFTLGAGTSGINPVTQAVTLQIGPYSVTIPAGSFKLNTNGAYVYSGIMGGVLLQLRINPVGGNSYTLQASASGANLTGISNPVTVTLTIGNDTGSTPITAQIS